MANDTSNASATALTPLLGRLRSGLREQRNWVQLVRFGVVGASGYAVNLAVFAFAINVLDSGHRTAAVAAFLVAVANNFFWNRRWTFESRGRRRTQGARFLAVSLVGFVVAFAILELLVRAGMPALLAQAVAIAAATPMNFVGNKLWTFAERSAG